jgi:hypothetical protein
MQPNKSHDTKVPAMVLLALLLLVFVSTGAPAQTGVEGDDTYLDPLA